MDSSTVCSTSGASSAFTPPFSDIQIDPAAVYDALWNNCPAARFLVEREEDGHGFRIIGCNPAIAKSNYLPQKNLVGLSLGDIFSPRRLQEHYERYNRCIAAGSFSAFEEHVAKVDSFD